MTQTWYGSGLGAFPCANMKSLRHGEQQEQPYLWTHELINNNSMTLIEIELGCKGTCRGNGKVRQVKRPKCNPG